MILNIIYDGEEHKVWNSELKKYGKQEEHTKKINAGHIARIVL